MAIFRQYMVRYLRGSWVYRLSSLILTALIGSLCFAPIANAAQIQHVTRTTISVTDLDKSLAIYRDILGFRVSRYTEPGEDSYAFDVFGVPATAHLRMAVLSVPDGQSEPLALMQVTHTEFHPRALPVAAAVVLRVEDVSSVSQQLREIGLTTLPPKEMIGVLSFDFIEGGFKDFDGNSIVLYQLLD